MEMTDLHLQEGTETLLKEGFSAKCGDLVDVRPCNDNQTYLGVYIGDLALGIAVNPENGEMMFASHNPLIYIPEKKCTVLGIESWWSKHNPDGEVREITDADIKKQVDALLSMAN